MTFYITISLICLVSFLIILLSLNNQKDSLEKQLKDTSSVNTWITVVKILLVISLGVFCFGIYVTFKSDFTEHTDSSFLGEVRQYGKNLVSNISSSVSPPTTFSDEWVSVNIRNLTKLKNI